MRGEGGEMELRERIARIIDPEAWRSRDYNLSCEADRLAWNTMEGLRQAPGFRQAADEAVEDSLAKAGEIIAALSTPPQKKTEGEV